MFARNSHVLFTAGRSEWRLHACLTNSVPCGPLFFCTRDSVAQNVKVNNEPSLRTSLTGEVVAQHLRGLARREARPNLEAEEAGQVHVNLHKTLEQPSGQINERAHPPVLMAVSRETIANSSPEWRLRTKVQRVLVGKR